MDDSIPSAPMPLDAAGDRRNPDAPITRSDLAHVQRQLADGHLRMNAIESELRNNTALTAEVREMFALARAGLRVLGAIGTAAQWLAKIAAGAAALWAAWQAIRHGK